MPWKNHTHGVHMFKESCIEAVHGGRRYISLRLYTERTSTEYNVRHILIDK